MKFYSIGIQTFYTFGQESNGQIMPVVSQAQPHFLLDASNLNNPDFILTQPMKDALIAQLSEDVQKCVGHYFLDGKKQQ